MIKINVLVLYTASIIFGTWGQGNQPTKMLSAKEQEAAFKKNVQLDQIPKGAIELELKYLIPSDKEIEEKEIYFKNVVSFAMDERRHIYIPDSAIIVIYEFDEAGKLIHKFEKRGKGPGELSFPSYVFPIGQDVLVYDGTPRNMIVYDRNWKYLKNFSCFNIGPPVSRDGKSFYGYDALGKRLISAIDSEGKLTGSFGELLYPFRSPLSQMKLGISHEGFIWAGLSGLGIIQKYSPSGHLEREIDLMKVSSPLLKKYLAQNYEWEKEYERGGISRNYPLLQSFAFIDNDVLVMGGGIVQPIFRFDSQGTLKGAYYIQSIRSLFKESFFVLIEKNSEERFYVLQKNFDTGDKRIGVYGRKSK